MTDEKTLPIPLNFLLGCSETELDNFELARLDKVSGLRKRMLEIMDELIEESAVIRLVSFFRVNDRAALKHALETEESPLEWAKRMVRGGGEIIPRVCLDPKEARARRNASYIAYQKRNIAAGKCRHCPKPLAHNSVQYCEEHLAKVRVRMRAKKGLADPGSREFLYAGQVEEPAHGRHPGTLTSLAMSREKRTRALLAELGIPPENAAITLTAAVEALLKNMPQSEAEAVTQVELFSRATIPCETTGRKALMRLLADGQIQRAGKGTAGRRNAQPFRYWLKGAE